MPRGQPFTVLCQATRSTRIGTRVDLHIHSTFSDGTYTPAEVIDLARRSGLPALALTDHDTLAGIPAARAAAERYHLEVIPGVELTAERAGREVHILGYFVSEEEPELRSVLERMRLQRLQRFQEMIARLADHGVQLPAQALQTQDRAGTLGRRNLADLLVQCHRVRSVREAFVRYLGDGNRIVAPKLRLDVAEAIRLIRQAGGVAALAHPPYDCEQRDLAELRRQGLAAVEVAYPGGKRSWGRQLRTWASELGLAVTGGSDCHGPAKPDRSVGGQGITVGELEALRQRATL